MTTCAMWDLDSNGSNCQRPAAYLVTRNGPDGPHQLHMCHKCAAAIRASHARLAAITGVPTDITRMHTISHP